MQGRKVKGPNLPKAVWQPVAFPSGKQLGMSFSDILFD